MCSCFVASYVLIFRQCLLFDAVDHTHTHTHKYCVKSSGWATCAALLLQQPLFKLTQNKRGFAASSYLIIALWKKQQMTTKDIKTAHFRDAKKYLSVPMFYGGKRLNQELCNFIRHYSHVDELLFISVACQHELNITYLSTCNSARQHQNLTPLLVRHCMKELQCLLVGAIYHHVSKWNNIKTVESDES